MAKAMEAIEVDIEDLRQEFRRLRCARKLSQKEAGDLVGLSQAFMSAFERGTYSKSRRHSLNQVWNLVQFWKRAARGMDVADVPSHGVVAGSARRWEAPPVHSACTGCGKPATAEDPPARYCSGCGEALGVKCACGYITRDRQANFCSRCARDLQPEAARVRAYPKYRDPAEANRLKLVRGFLKAADAEIEPGSRAKAESEAREE